MTLSIKNYNRSRNKSFTILLFFLFITFFSCRDDTTGIDTKKISTLNPGMNSIKITHGGLERELIIQLPSSFKQSKVYSVVFFFHGLNGNTELGKRVIGPIVESDDVIGVYPQGHLGSWNDGGNEVPSKADDIGFTLQIIKLLQQEVKIDENRIYTLGYSNGASFSFYLAMKTDKFASIATLCASFFIDRKIESSAKKTSVFQINGESDVVVPYEGGKSSYLPIIFASAFNTAKAWAIHNGLNENPEISIPGNKITLYSFKGNGHTDEVRLYKLHETTHELVHEYIYTMQCYRDIWEFFKQHPKIEE